MSSMKEKKAADGRKNVPSEEQKISEGNKHLLPLPASTTTKGSSNTNLNESNAGKKDKKAQGIQDVPSVSGITNKNIDGVNNGNKHLTPPPESAMAEGSLIMGNKLNESNGGKKENKNLQGIPDIPSNSGATTKSSANQPGKTDRNDEGNQVTSKADDQSRSKQWTKLKESEKKETGNKVKQIIEEPQQNINKKDKKSK